MRDRGVVRPRRDEDTHVPGLQTGGHRSVGIRVRSKQVTVVTLNGEIIHDGDFAISRILR
jgi:hypothetical protein